MKAAAKRHVRSVVDRVAMPYVNAVVARLGGPGATSQQQESQQPVAASQGHHSCTSSCMNFAPSSSSGCRRAPRVLSIGASARWYFDWFESAVGAVEEHLGVEAFEVMPGDLPPYATWIADTADHMVGVEDASVDLVFAGQTTEHFWSGELSGFLEEAHRVLREDGLLVLDSPNRLVTEHLNWTHEGHTVELSLDEISELVELAGFEVLSTAGIWRSEIDGRHMQLEDGLGDSATFTRRATTARDNPDESFIWWINPRRTDAEPDSERLRSRTKELYQRHWSTRVCRGLFPVPGGDQLAITPSSSGSVGTTLPFMLKEGTLTITATLLSGVWDDLEGFVIEIAGPDGELLHELRPQDAERNDLSLHWHVQQPKLVFGAKIELRVEAVRSPALLKLPLDMDCDV